MGIRSTIKAQSFTMNGSILPLEKATGASMWSPSRPMGGWLATYGKIAADGKVVPTRDRDGQNFEAARELGHIDWAPYLQTGAFNDTHDEAVIVGYPTLLEYHDELSDLAKAHRKVGFWTEGYLIDRDDPQTWEQRGKPKPKAEEFERADYFWKLSQLLKGTPRPLTLSAHGKYISSPCGKRIIWARVQQGAICEVPKNPDATLFPLQLGTPITIGMVGANPCDTCSCPAGACRGLLRKGISTTANAPVDDKSVDDDAPEESNDETGPRVQRLVRLLSQRMRCSEADALTWVKLWLKHRTDEKEATNAHRNR